MNETVVKEVLDAIHIMLKNNGFAFTLEQISSTDDFIIPFISELGIDSKEFNVEKKGVPRLVNDKRIIPIFIRYFALIEDNKELYEKLKKEDYVFYENHVIKFYALDRLLSAKFDIDEYIRLLNEYGKIRISIDLITIKEKCYVLFYDYYKGEILAIWIFDGLDDPKLTLTLTPYFNNENIELIVSVRGYVSKFVPILKEISPKNTKFISYLKF